MGIETWLNWISMGLIVIWTMRLASTKKQNPWVWALASIGLIAIPFMFNQPFMGILGMLPMLFLLVLRKPKDAADNDPSENITRINCPKCDVSHLNNYKYCVNCGWQLNEIYNGINDENSQYGTDHSLGLTNEEAHNVVQADGIDAKAHLITPDATVLQDSDDDLIPQVQPRSSFRMPTLSAESLTTKGSHLFTEGRFQEAADQFTKAIALDPKYYLAWSKRADTYLRMGLTQKAQEDLRNLEGI